MASKVYKSNLEFIYLAQSSSTMVSNILLSFGSIYTCNINAYNIYTCNTNAYDIYTCHDIYTCNINLSNKNSPIFTTSIHSATIHATWILYIEYQSIRHISSMNATKNSPIYTASIRATPIQYTTSLLATPIYTTSIHATSIYATTIHQSQYRGKSFIFYLRARLQCIMQRMYYQPVLVK